MSLLTVSHHGPSISRTMHVEDSGLLKKKNANDSERMLESQHELSAGAWPSPILSTELQIQQRHPGTLK